MKIGYSLSPGGLLLPYHVGVLQGLQSKSLLDPSSTPVAGSSAGAIAAAIHGCGIAPEMAIDATTQLSAQCVESGSQKLVQGLRSALEEQIGPEQIELCQTRPIGVAYQQLFPIYQPILQTQFDQTSDLINAVCFSSTFPFFSSPLPFAIDTTTALGRPFPRLVVDGFFTVPRDRFGCPDFTHAQQNNINNDKSVDERNSITTNPFADCERTICISCFPPNVFGLTAVPETDIIGPSLSESEDPDKQLQEWIRLATQPLEDGQAEYAKLYERGFRDAEDWAAKQPKHDESNMAESTPPSSFFPAWNWSALHVYGYNSFSDWRTNLVQTHNKFRKSRALRHMDTTL